MSLMEPMLDDGPRMRRFRISLQTILVVVVLAFGVYQQGVGAMFRPQLTRVSRTGAITPAPVADDGTVLVAHAADGDTIVLEGGESVRYIGIDTPETVDPRRPVQCFGPEASKANKALVDGKRVRLVADVEDRDKYHRMLRYVYLQDGTFVNLELARQGFAPAYTYPPNVAHTEEFRVAAREAREAKRGLWAKCPGVRTDRGESAYRKLKAS
ncbi:MAG: thermonuclease family protein [bacterium]|nr:thermonuclease family protein [bacterium]